MKVIVEKIADRFRRACEMTLRPGQTSKISFARMLQCEHSPIRTVRYWIELHAVKTFVSVHLVRHKQGVEHFVQSNRTDRGGAGDNEVTRNTPVNHGVEMNAASLIAVSRKRLCLNSTKQTVAAWTKVRNAVEAVDPVMAQFMVPECVYRNGLCPELRPCEPGPAKVCAAYPQWPGTRADR